MYTWIYHNKQSYKHVFYNTKGEVTLEVNEYLLKDSHIDIHIQ